MATTGNALIDPQDRLLDYFPQKAFIVTDPGCRNDQTPSLHWPEVVIQELAQKN
jgi:hypothetical protein